MKAEVTSVVLPVSVFGYRDLLREHGDCFSGWTNGHSMAFSMVTDQQVMTSATMCSENCQPGSYTEISHSCRPPCGRSKNLSDKSELCSNGNRCSLLLLRSSRVRYHTSAVMTALSCTARLLALFYREGPERSLAVAVSL